MRQRLKGGSLTTAQIGASGVLLIQYRLLRRGIESAPMTTDAGIDLVVYAPQMEKALTVQVKTCLQPKPAGGHGKLACDWSLPQKKIPADLVGLVNIKADRAWLFRHDEFIAKAQQNTERGWHLYFYVDPDYQAKDGCHENDFSPFLIESRIEYLFGKGSQDG